MTRGKWLGVLVGASVAVGGVSAEAQVVALHAGFHPELRTLHGVAGGPVSAQTVDPACRGFLPVGPQQRVFLQTPMPFVRIWASSEQDTTLMVRAPNGQVFCADDTWGTNPGVDIQSAMRGQYEVFVGTYSQGNTAPYTLGLSEQRTSAPQQQGLGEAMPVPSTDDAATMVAPPPSGYPLRPPVVVQQPPAYPSPPVMVVQPPQPPQPPYGYQGGTVIQPGFVPDPRILSGISGGPLSAQTVDPSCRGFMNTSPNHTIQVTGPENFLRFWVRSQGDTTLLVRAPTGQVFCADDTYGLNPGVDLNGAPPGTYQVFVGSYASGQSYPYELGISELPNSTPSGGYGYVTPPSGPQPPVMYGNSNGVVSLAPGFVPDPQTRTGISGGPISAMGLNASCRGYVDTTPSQTVYLAAPFNFLRVFVQSESDTTMLIRGPNGEVYCADDTYGLNPGIDLTGAAPGIYQVFIGSYSQGNAAPYSVSFTESPGLHP